MKPLERKPNLAVVWAVAATVITGLFGYTAISFVRSENNLDLVVDLSLTGLKIQTRVDKPQQFSGRTDGNDTSTTSLLEGSTSNK